MDAVKQWTREAWREYWSGEGDDKPLVGGSARWILGLVTLLAVAGLIYGSAEWLSLLPLAWMMLGRNALQGKDHDDDPYGD